MYSVSEEIKKLSPYISGNSIKGSIKLSSNENSWGVSEKVKNAIPKIGESINRYPDGNGSSLKRRLSVFLGNKFNEKNFVLGTGSNEIINVMMQVFLSSDGEVVAGEYSFFVYRMQAKINNSKITLAKSNKDFSNNIDNIIAACNTKTSIVIIDNPNNPTGTIVSKKEMQRLLEFTHKNKIILFVDEAYIEFVRTKEYSSMLGFIKDYDNLIVSRTFSKVYGLSSIRLGYAVANEWIVDFFNRVRAPFNTSAFAQNIAEIALEDQSFVLETVKKTHSGIDFIYNSLKEIGFDFIETQCNFITIKTPININAKQFYEKMLEHKIIVRPLINYGLNNYIRLTIGTKDENKKVAKALTACF